MITKHKSTAEQHTGSSRDVINENEWGVKTHLYSANVTTGGWLLAKNQRKSCQLKAVADATAHFA